MTTLSKHIYSLFFVAVGVCKWFVSSSLAYPNLIEHNLCGDDAHPSTKKVPHKEPRESSPDEMLMKLSWANINASNVPREDENNQGREISRTLFLSTLEYCDSCRFTLSIFDEANPEKESQMLITTTGGEFFDQGAYMDGKLDSDGVMCSFRRYNIRRQSNTHHLIWTAPHSSSPNQKSDERVVFSITAVSEKDGHFMQSKFVLTRNNEINLWNTSNVTDDQNKDIGDGKETQSASRRDSLTEVAAGLIWFLFFGSMAIRCLIYIYKIWRSRFTMQYQTLEEHNHSDTDRCIELTA